jgi:hypothetical protein
MQLAPRWERGSVSVQAKPVPDIPVPEGAAVPVVRRAFTVIANPETAAQLSLMGSTLVRRKLPPDCAKISSTHQ